MWRVTKKLWGNAGSWSRRQLAKVEQTIANIENSNFVVRYFNKGSLDMLKKQQQYIKVMIEKEKAFVEYRRLQWTPNQADIVKANKALEKQLKAGEDIKYVSRKEENRIANKPKRRTRSDKWKSHNWAPRVLKASELKPHRLFYE